MAEVQLAGINQAPAQVHATSESQVLVPVMCLMTIHRVFALKQQSVVVGFRRLESSPDLATYYSRDFQQTATFPSVETSSSVS